MIELPKSILECNDFLCDRAEHADIIESLYESFIYACSVATKEAILHIRKDKKKSFSWSDDLSLSRQKALFWRNIWRECGKPRDGELVKVMRFTQNRY